MNKSHGECYTKLVFGLFIRAFDGLKLWQELGPPKRGTILGFGFSQ